MQSVTSWWKSPADTSSRERCIPQSFQVRGVNCLRNVGNPNTKFLDFLGDANWQANTGVTINDGEYRGFLKEDGTFIINGVPSGSYVVEIVNADYFYEPVIIDPNRSSPFYNDIVSSRSAWRSTLKASSVRVR